jgi:hypothetical protein
MIRTALKFPPVLVFVIILICGTVVNVAAIFYTESDSMQKMYFLNPSAVLTSTEVKKPGRIDIMITTGSEGDYSGWVAVVYVYSPDGKLFDVRYGTIDNTGNAIINVWFGKLVPSGNYTILPAVGFDSTHLSIGEPVFLKVTGGDGE